MEYKLFAKISKKIEESKKNYLCIFIFIVLITATRAIVLNTFKYGDSSLIANLYTELFGRQTVFMKGVYSKKSAKSIALLQPLHLLETAFHYRSNRQMQRVSSVHLFYPFQTIPFDPVKRCITLFIAEILYKTLREEEANSDLFNFLLHTIQTLDLNEQGTANFHLAFMVHYSRYLGFYPNSEQAYSPHPEYNALLLKLFAISFDRLDDLPINQRQRNYLAEYLLGYYSTHVENFGKMKSFEVLQNIFQ